MALFAHNGFAWAFLTGIQAQFNTTSKCQLNLYQGTIPSADSYTEAAYTADLIVKWDTNFSMEVHGDTGGLASVCNKRPILTNAGGMPTAIATGTGTVTWAALVNPTAPTVVILSTVVGLGDSCAIIINNQNGTGNVITTGDIVTIVNFSISLSTT